MKISGSSPTFVNCSFQRCSAPSGSGGAVSIDGASNPAFQRCSFDGNSAILGGGQQCVDLSQFILIIIAAMSITSGKVQILSSLFSGNFADIHGGAFFTSQGTVLIRSTLFVMVRDHVCSYCSNLTHFPTEWSELSRGSSCCNCWQCRNSIKQFYNQCCSRQFSGHLRRWG